MQTFAHPQMDGELCSKRGEVRLWQGFKIHFGSQVPCSSSTETCVIQDFNPASDDSLHVRIWIYTRIYFFKKHIYEDITQSIFVQHVMFEWKEYHSARPG